MPPSSKKTLILFAHPAIHKSRLNRALADEVRALPGVTFHDLYETYPDSIIDVGAEQKLLLQHDRVVFQHPFYWYSTPSILKEWMDLVLEYGFAYGEKGTRLNGKTWVHAMTTGGHASSYAREGSNRFTIEELLAPLAQSAFLCGMRFEKPFLVHGSPEVETPDGLVKARRAYREFILGTA